MSLTPEQSGPETQVSRFYVRCNDCDCQWWVLKIDLSHPCDDCGGEPVIVHEDECEKSLGSDTDPCTCWVQSALASLPGESETQHPLALGKCGKQESKQELKAMLDVTLEALDNCRHEAEYGRPEWWVKGIVNKAIAKLDEMKGRGSDVQEGKMSEPELKPCSHDMRGDSFMTTKNVYIISMKVKCQDCGEIWEWVNLAPMNTGPTEDGRQE